MNMVSFIIDQMKKIMFLLKKKKMKKLCWIYESIGYNIPKVTWNIDLIGKCSIIFFTFSCIVNNYPKSS